MSDPQQSLQPTPPPQPTPSRPPTSVQWQWLRRETISRMLAVTGARKESTPSRLSEPLRRSHTVCTRRWPAGPTGLGTRLWRRAACGRCRWPVAGRMVMAAVKLMKRRTTETARPVMCFFPLLVGSPLQPPLPPLPPNTSLLIYGTRGSASESARPHLPEVLVEATSYGDAPPAAIAPASGGYRTSATDLEWAAAAEWAVSFAPQIFAPRVASRYFYGTSIWHLQP